MSQRPLDKPILITGGAGFIGANLAALLAERLPGVQLVIVDDFRVGTFETLIDAFDRRGLTPFDGAVLPISLTDVDPLDLIADVDPAIVLHQAAITDTTIADEREMLGVNTQTMRPILEGVEAVGARLVYASSAATYGSPPEADTGEPFRLSSAGKPNNVYGFSKWLMECEHRRFDEDRAARGEAPLQAIGLRYFNVFGPGETHKGKMASIAHQLTRQVLAGDRPRLFEHGEQVRDQIHVDDVCECVLAAAGLGERQNPDVTPTPGVYNLGSGRTTSYAEVADAVRRGLGVEGERFATEYFPMPESIAAFYQSYTCDDLPETERGLGWTPARDPSAATAEYAAWLGARSEHAIETHGGGA